VPEFSRKLQHQGCLAAGSVAGPDFATRPVAADQAFTEAKVAWLEARIGKQPIIEMRDAAAAAAPD